MRNRRLPWLALACLLWLAARPALAFLGLAIGDQRLFFMEPSLSEQDGVLDAQLDAASPDLDFDQFQGTSLGAAYGFSVNSVGDGVRARWDRYRLRGGLLPGPMRLLGKSLRLGFGLQAGAEIAFLRHYGSGKEALRARPLEPWVLGSTDAILERMRPGDLASVPIQAELLLQAAIKTPIMGIPTRPSVFLKLGGSFQMNLLRLRDDRVRIRLMGMRERSHGAAFKAGFLWDVELVELLGEQVRFLTELSLLKASWTRKHGKGMLLDATLDLADPDARRAFELLFHHPLHFATGRREELLSVGWALIQDLAARDEEREPEERRATLHHCGLIRYDQDAWRLKLGNSLLRWGRRELSTLLEFAPHDPSSPTLLIASSLSAGKKEWLLRPQGKWFFESQVFARKDPDGIHPVLWSLRYRVKERRFSRADLENLREKLRFQVGPDRAPALPDLPEGEVEAGKADIQVRLSWEAVEALAAIDRDELARRFDAWLRLLDPGSLWRQANLVGIIRLPDRLHRLLQEVVHAPDAKNLAALADLRERYDVFGEVGAGFLLSLLDPRPDDPRVSVSVSYKARATGKVKFSLGSFEERPSEAALPVLRFLETGTMELQREAAEMALESRVQLQERQDRFGQLHR